MNELTTVEVRGKDSSSRTTARINAAQELGRELNRRGLIDVGDTTWRVHPFGPGRFYATASVQARLR